MNIIADLHTHTTASTHAYSTINEMVKAAADIGLYAIAITDHGMAMDGAPDVHYFRNLRIIPKELIGVRVLKGIEANIIDYNGRLDADNNLLSKLEWVVASMHTITLKGTPDVDKCTAAYLAVCDNPYVNVIGHSGSEFYKYDYETVIKRCAQTSTLVEINNASFGFRKGSEKCCRQIALLCKKHNARIVVDSDAHFFDRVGKFPSALQLLSEIDFPSELIVNSSVENLHEYFIEKNITI